MQMYVLIKKFQLTIGNINGFRKYSKFKNDQFSGLLQDYYIKLRSVFSYLMVCMEKKGQGTRLMNNRNEVLPI